MQNKIIMTFVFQSLFGSRVQSLPPPRPIRETCKNLDEMVFCAYFIYLSKLEQNSGVQGSLP